MTALKSTWFIETWRGYIITNEIEGRKRLKVSGCLINVDYSNLRMIGDWRDASGPQSQTQEHSSQLEDKKQLFQNRLRPEGDIEGRKFREAVWWLITWTYVGAWCHFGTVPYAWIGRQTLNDSFHIGLMRPVRRASSLCVSIMGIDRRTKTPVWRWSLGLTYVLNALRCRASQL
jgi:hypothetical protein